MSDQFYVEIGIGDVGFDLLQRAAGRKTGRGRREGHETAIRQSGVDTHHDLPGDVDVDQPAREFTVKRPKFSGSFGIIDHVQNARIGTRQGQKGSNPSLVAVEFSIVSMTCDIRGIGGRRRDLDPGHWHHHDQNQQSADRAAQSDGEHQRAKLSVTPGSVPGNAVHMQGGQFKAPTRSLADDTSVEYFRKIMAGKLFLATGGVALDTGLTYPSFADPQL